MKKFQLASVSSPSIEFECGGHVIHSTVIKNTQKSPNFDQPLFFFDVVSPHLRFRSVRQLLPFSRLNTVEPRYTTTALLRQMSLPPVKY